MQRPTPETADDYYEVEYLFDLAFGPTRTGLSSYRLRDGIEPLTSLARVARDESGAVAGAIRYWPIRVGEGGVPALLLGPVAVHPTHQGEGLGGVLIEESLAAAADAGWTLAVLVGDAPYYGRFGFSRVPLVFPPPTNPERVLARPLASDALSLASGPVRRWDAV